ncbi:hypothetical protein [Hyalangium minutum]|uniref:Uncharacterized protein n=1 Tax=Hyalangium minutum TaxID=394096 RepID=A0A085WEU4_9BACT|nr:hypothetical protein [Hyalangium minutum]KFE66207.1 hypothetical protein DB31_1272 [Hyalangium minutum]
MRWLLIMVALGAGGTAGYLGTVSKNSFSDYSREQLDLLERELSQELAQQGSPTRPSKNTAKRAERQEQLAANQQLLQEERQRRSSLYMALGVAGAAAVAAFFVRAGASSPKRRGSRDEDARLMATIGDPAVLRAGARQKAAALLGVSPEAPPAVIEAALQAQLQQRDLSRLEGLAPDLQKLALQQREELVRARDLLVGPAPSKPGSRGS